MEIGYTQNVMEGVRSLTQLGSQSDGLKESKRIARYLQGWQFPRSCCVESREWYWRRYVLPNIGLCAGRAEYLGSLQKLMASFGLSPTPVKPPTDLEANPNGIAEAKSKLKVGKGNTLTAGAQDAARLYPAGKRLLKPERNISMANASRAGKEFL